MHRDPAYTLPPVHPREGDEANIVDLWRALRRRWALLAAVTVATTAAVVGVTLLIPPVFESEGVLRVRSAERGSGMLADMLPIPGLSIPGIVGGDVVSEIGVLRSRRIAERVADSVALHVELTRPYRARRTDVLAVVEAGRDAVRGEYTLRRRPDGSYSIEYEGRERVEVPARVAIGEPFEVGNMTLMLEPRHAGDAPDRVAFRVRRFQRVVTRLRDGIRIARQDAGSSLIEVVYRHRDPRIAAGVVNATIDYFLEYSSEFEKYESRRQARILEEQVRDYERRLREAEVLRQAFQERERIVAPEEQAIQQVRRIAEVQARHDAMRVERAALGRLLARIGAGPDPAAAGATDDPPYRQLATFPSFIANGAVQDVLQALIELQNERAELLGRRTERNEDVRVLDGRIAELEGQLVDVGINYLRGLDHQIASAEVALDEFTAELAAIPEVEVEFARLVREQELLNEVYLLLKARLSEVQVQEAIDDAAVRVIDYGPVMERPAFPRPLVSLVLATVLGLMAGMFTVVGVETLDPNVRSRKDAELAAPGVPVLGVIPPLRPLPPETRSIAGRIRVGPLPLRGNGARRTESLVAMRDPWHPASEAFRALAACLYGDPTARNRALVVTSALPDDGRSGVAANLAITLARGGARCLLLDADLRAGGVATLLGVPPTPGWPGVLLDDASLDDAIHQVSAGSGSRATLDVLPAGSLDVHPAEILGSTGLRDLIERLRERYDAIVIDSPPFRPAFDAATLGGLADGVLLVVRSGATARETLEQAAADLQRARARLVGVVLTEHAPASTIAAYPAGVGERVTPG